MDDERFQKGLVYRVPGMDAIEPPRRLTYKRVEETELVMDVYMPPGLPSDARAPGVIFIHGGPLPADARPLPTDWGIFVSYGQLMAATGLVGVTFNHRFSSPMQLEQSASDVSAAIEYVRTHADTLQIDPDRLCVWAFSGGGPQLSVVLRHKPAYVRCIVAYYALLDLRHLTQEGAGQITEETKIRFSPAAHLKENAAAVPPLFVARAGLDPTINLSIDRFVAEALAANVPLDLANHSEGRHAFDILDDDPRTQEILARTVQFVKTHLEPVSA